MRSPSLWDPVWPSSVSFDASMVNVHNKIHHCDEFGNKLLFIIKAQRLSALMKFVTRTCREVFHRVAAYSNRPV